MHTQKPKPNPHLTPSAAHPPDAPHKTEGANSSYPSFSFADLGASRAVRMTVLVALSIVGTAETIFYARALYRYFNPPADGDVELGALEDSSERSAKTES